MSDKVPAALVYVTGEEIPDEAWQRDGSAAIARDLTISIEFVLPWNEAADETADTQARIIEALLDGWNLPGFEPCIPRLVSTAFSGLEDQESPTFHMKMDWLIRYHTPRYQEEPFNV